MESNPNGEIGMRVLQARIRAAYGGATRGAIADRASTIASAMWGDDAPRITEEAVRDIDSRLVNPPGDGRVMRCVLAAAGVNLVDALTDLGMWPDVSASGAASLSTRVAMALRICGLKDAKLVGTSGRVIRIQI